MPKTCTISLDPNAMRVVPSPGAITELLARVNIERVDGVFNQKPVSATQEEWAYPFDNMTILNVSMKDKTYFSVELQDVTNQATWSTGLKSGLNQAIADINAWL